MNKNDIEGFVLAGGASRRMGRDKTCLPLGDSTLVERAATTLSFITTKKISLVGDSLETKLSDELQNKFRLLPDVFESNDKTCRAAIIGLRSAFLHSKAPWAAILACDLPFISRDFFRRLASLRSRQFDAIVPVQPDGRWQPLCAFYRVASCLPLIAEMLAENILSLKELLQRVRTRRVEFAEYSDLPNSENFFLNVNTPEDYELALKLTNLK